MKVGVIVYSQTGNTLSVAQRVEEALRGNGHAVEIARVEAEPNPSGQPSQVKLTSLPDVSPYDAVVFASPVQAFSLAQAMKKYLAQVSGLAGKQMYCYVTQQLKKPWLGGNHALRQIKAACKTAGAQAEDAGVVHWSSDSREAQIEAVANKLCAQMPAEGQQ